MKPLGATLRVGLGPVTDILRRGGYARRPRFKACSCLNREYKGCPCVYICVYIYNFTDISIHMYVYLYIYIFMYVGMYVCMNLYIHMHGYEVNGGFWVDGFYLRTSGEQS